MDSAFSLQGSYTSTPPCGFSGVGAPSIGGQIAQNLSLIGQQVNSLDLESDPAVPINFDNITQAQVLVVQVQGGYVDIIVSTPAGATQKIRVDAELILVNQQVPITALSIQREPATPVSASIFLGQTT